MDLKYPPFYDIRDFCSYFNWGNLSDVEKEFCLLKFATRIENKKKRIRTARLARKQKNGR